MSAANKSDWASAAAYYSTQLRAELAERNRAYARAHSLPHVESYGGASVIVYEPFGSPPRHGNFGDEVYSAILANPEWRKRFAKVHTSARQALPKSERRWRELDSSNSSDALLMNIFSRPGVCAERALLLRLGLDEPAAPEFGYRARVPLKSGLLDRTEVDMKLGPLLVEAKLTESGFQSRALAGVNAYRDFGKVFDRSLLPRTKKSYEGYQLIRNVLAAQATGSRFCLMHDARRPDLREAWYSVLSAVKPAALRTRCTVLTWQELAAALPTTLQEFLGEKYGIVPA